MSQYHEGNVPIPGYELVEFLGRGSYGEVWKATGPGGTEVAIKFIALDSQQGLKEFKAIGLVKRLRHPNLVPIHAFWLRDSLGNVISDAPAGESLETESGRFRLGGRKELVIAMGLGDRSLAQKADDARETGGIAQRQLLRYMDGAARGIDFLNEPVHPPGNSPIIHCDIKPANLLIVGGEVQVCDYGVAQALGTDMKKTLTAGTPAYAPPELINNDPCRQTDQYSLAITYFELRTGQLPFDEKQALRANITGDLDLSLLERDERAVIRRATSLQPERRYPSVQDFVDELRVACGVSLSRSAVIPRALERRPPPTALPPSPSSPSVRTTPKNAPPAPPMETVTFPESMRPTAPAPKPAPRKDDAPWAESTALTPALPSTPTPTPKMRRQWLWPLVIGLVVGIGGVVAYVVTRPGPTPVVVEPQPSPEVVKSLNAGDILKSLQDATFATPADFPTSAGRIDAALKTADLPAEQLSKLRAELPKLVASKLDAGEEPFKKWLDTLTVPALSLGKDREVGAAQKWYAAATDFATKRGDKDTAARFAALQKFAEFAAKVVATATPADRVGYYDRALADAGALPVPRRYSFLLKPLVTDTFADLAADRRANAAKALVRGVAEFTEIPLPAGESMPDLVALLVRAYELAAPDTVDAVMASPRRDKLPREELARKLLWKGYEAETRAALQGKSPQRQWGKPAIDSYEDALRLSVGRALVADCHLRAAIFLYLFAEAAEPADQLQYKVRSFRHYQMAYILAAERAEAKQKAEVFDPVIAGDVALVSKGKTYTDFSETFAAQRGSDPATWDALAAECVFMRSAMDPAARKELTKARDAIPKTAADALGDSRDRMTRLLALTRTPAQLRDLLKP